MASTGSGDRQLVDAVLSGNADAYRELVERESHTVVGLCAAIVGDRDEAQDVAQDAFVQAYRSLATYRGDGTFGAWIGRIATRMAIAHAAAVGRRRPILADEELGNAVPDEQANPERQVVSHERDRAIRQAIDGLPRDQRQVVTLRFFHDMPLERIALVTQAPLGTVKSRLHRALARLRDEDHLRPVS